MKVYLVIERYRSTERILRIVDVYEHYEDAIACVGGWRRIMKKDDPYIFELS